MGTRASVAVLDRNGRTIVEVYRQFDGYLSGLGQELQDFCDRIHLVNGFNADHAHGSHANGMECLAAQLVERLKAGRLGGTYLIAAGFDWGQEYRYRILPGQVHPILQVQDEGDNWRDFAIAAETWGEW